MRPEIIGLVVHASNRGLCVGLVLVLVGLGTMAKRKAREKGQGNGGPKFAQIMPHILDQVRNFLASVVKDMLIVSAWSLPHATITTKELVARHASHPLACNQATSTHAAHTTATRQTLQGVPSGTPPKLWQIVDGDPASLLLASLAQMKIALAALMHFLGSGCVSLATVAHH